jgi:hypothetical protein
MLFFLWRDQKRESRLAAELASSVKEHVADLKGVIMSNTQAMNQNANAGYALAQALQGCPVKPVVRPSGQLVGGAVGGGE